MGGDIIYLIYKTYKERTYEEQKNYFINGNGGSPSYRMRIGKQSE